MLIMFSTVPLSMSTSSVNIRTWSATSARYILAATEISAPRVLSSYSPGVVAPRGVL
jgi:hypothetical protein